MSLILTSLVLSSIVYLIIGFFLCGAWFVLGHGREVRDVVLCVFLGLTWPVWVLVIVASGILQRLFAW